MSLSKKGILTEIDILNSAKTLFYQRGYAKSSMRDIGKYANVKLGTLTYYFKKKEDLARRIYSDNVIRIYSFVKENRPLKMPSLELNFMMTCFYQYSYSIDQKTNDFHLEIISHKDIYEKIYNQLFYQLYATLYREVAKGMTKHELDISIISDLAVKRELSYRFLEKPFPKDFKEHFKDSETMMGRIFKIPEDVIQEYINESLEFFNTHDHSKIRLLL